MYSYDPPDDLNDPYDECPDCGDTMMWCSFCEEWTLICCVNDGYGSCLCS